MIIPIPRRFPPRGLLIFVTVIFVAQQLAGTDLIFSLLTSIYLWLWATGVNIAGGIEYPSGAFILFNGFFTGVLGLTIKAALFQAGDRNLLSPRTTMVCYCMGMLGMVLAATLSRGLRPHQPLLRSFDNLEQMKQAYIACFIIGIILAFTSGNQATQGGSLITAVRQINRFPLMAILLGTVYEVRRSNGKRSLNWITLAGLIFYFAFGLLYFSKEGMLIGPAAWFLAAWLSGYSFSKTQLIGGALASFLVVYYLVPYSQYVRMFTTASKAENLVIALTYLEDLPETRRLYFASLEGRELSEDPHLFDQRITFIDRAVILPADDALIDFTEKGHIYGIEPTIQAYANIVPRFIWHNKVSLNTGNTFAHEIGEVAEDDSTTGIAFSPSADAFHEASWLGLLLLLPVSTFVAFIIMDSLAGSTRYSFWALLPILEISHGAAEAGLGYNAYLSSYWILAMLLLAFVTKVATPMIAKVIWRPNAPSSNAPASPQTLGSLAPR
jgi:hypothetical protein